MKNILLTLGLLINSIVGLSQAPSCNITNVSDIPVNFSTWNWEVGITDPDYCKTWASRTFNPCGATGICNMGSPWTYPGTDALLRIASQQDYKKANGWELIRLNFGGGVSSEQFPYFILYNKSEGLMRVFIWVNQTGLTGVVVTLNHSSLNSNSSSILSGNNEPMKASDKYKVTSTQDELVAYVTQFSGPNKWVVAEFRPTFDPYIQDALYTGNHLKFKMYGIISSDVHLSGTIEFKTEDYSVASTETDLIANHPDGSNFKKFIMEGKKYVDYVKDSDAEAMVTKMHNQAQDVWSKISAAQPDQKFKLAVFRTLNEVVKATEDGSKFKNLVGTVIGAAKGASGVLGVVGNVVGMLWPDETSSSAPTVFNPTISRGSLTLSGTIKTTLPLTEINVQTPGSLHNASIPTTLPYYDCPLGLFNLKATPILEKYDYQIQTKMNYHTIKNQISYTELTNYSSYRVSSGNLFEYVCNSSSGLQIVSVQAAIIGEVHAKSDGTAAYNLFEPHSFLRLPPMDYTSTNPVLAEIEAGRYIVTQYDVSKTDGDPSIPNDGILRNLHVFQTPYVNIECFNGMTFNVPSGTKVSIRIKVILKKTGASDTSSPIFYIKDFTIDEISGSGPFYNTTNVPVGEQTYTGGFGGYGVVSSVLVPAGSYNYTASTTHNAFSYIEFSDGVAISTLSDKNVIFRAGASIEMLPQFEVTAGSNFEATLDYGYVLPFCNSNPAPTYSNIICNYNSSALKKGLFSEEVMPDEMVSIYPNPSSGIINLLFSYEDGKESEITISNSLGTEIAKFNRSLGLDHGLEINLGDQNGGVYFIKIKIDDKITSQKVVITK